MSTLFISDLHLCEERPQVTRLFLDFLEQRASKAEALYVLGDLFEAWVGDDAMQAAERPIIEGFRQLGERGVPVFVMHGNRDFLLGQAFAEMSGTTLLADPSVIDLYGTPTLLMHGDSLCTDDVEHQQFRAMVRNPLWQQQALALSPEERWAMARKYRELSKEKTRLKPEDIMDVNQDAVEASMREQGVRQFIHGHTHRPAVHHFLLDGREATRIVLGDWYDQGSVLCCDPFGCRLESVG